MAFVKPDILKYYPLELMLKEQSFQEDFSMKKTFNSYNLFYFSLPE